MKPENSIRSMFEKKFKAMQTSAASPNTTRESDGKSSSSSPQNTLQIEATRMESGSLSARKEPPAKNGQLVNTDFDACLAISIKCL
ncbi:hypothetical protein SOVF_134360, partial [Spinacia oleracea]